MSLHIRTDVTAVKMYNKYILAGIGSWLHVYSRDSFKLEGKYQMLECQKVYGFVPCTISNKIIVFGGKQFTVVSLPGADYEHRRDLFVKEFETIKCDDWLHSAIWIKEDVIALLTAHNVVQVWHTAAPKLKSIHLNEENSILYSGLLLPIEDDILVFAGTVFSEVLIHRCNSDKTLHSLKGHRGVIFSISCDLKKEVIVSTSDDRSVRIWAINNPESYKHNTIDYWENVVIHSKCEVYGHLARVMRNFISKDLIISVGEDSAICYWNFDGDLLKKNITHQNGCIWSLDADNDLLVTGGGDCGIIVHPLSSTVTTPTNVINLDSGTPRKVIFTARNNVVILNDLDELIYYDTDLEDQLVHKLEHKSTYKLVSISACKQIIAVADMNGKFDVFVEKCKGEPCLINIISTKISIGNILSMHWADNRHLVFCSDNGNITVMASNQAAIEVIDKFILPKCKERWLTAAATNDKGILVVGDRCGNIHVFVQGHGNPIQTFHKEHGRYGPTSITIKNNQIITTGRNGTIKYFSLDEDEVKYMNCRNMKFQWVEKFLDKNENIICGFQERVFVIHNIQDNSTLLEMPCGGGHRSWDVIRYFERVNHVYEEFVKLMYIKNSDINIATFEMSKIVSKSVVRGSHSNEINCLKCYRSELSPLVSYYISGGEDTTLRISKICNGVFSDELVFKHLSNIRTLRTLRLENDKLLLVSAGGRAQICVKILQFYQNNQDVQVTSQNIADFMIKGTDKQRKGNHNWKNISINFDPETRIMDLEIIQVNDKEFTIITGCSDANLRLFKLVFHNNIITFEPFRDIKYHETCILRMHKLKYNDKEVLVTCTTRGVAAFWDVTNVARMELELSPFFVTTTNKCGINCVTSQVVDNRLLIGTAGDDNAVYLTLLEISDENNGFSCKTINSWCSDTLHSSQVTGLRLLDNYVVSASIDQRVTLLRHEVTGDEVKCDFVKQVFSDVADIQGMDVVEHSREHVTLCVFGKGMEIIHIETAVRE